MTIWFDGSWHAYKSNGIDLIGIYPTNALATAAILAWEGE